MEFLNVFKGFPIFPGHLLSELLCFLCSTPQACLLITGIYHSCQKCFYLAYTCHLSENQLEKLNIDRHIHRFFF